MLEVVQEFLSDGVLIKRGTLDSKAIQQDHLDCALRNGWIVRTQPIESTKSPRGVKPKE